MIEAEAVSLRNTVLVGGVGGAFDDDGRPTSVATDAALNVLEGRRRVVGRRPRPRRAPTGQLAPGNARFMQELTALSSAERGRRVPGAPGWRR